MENNNYLIPANSKKSQLILGFFNPTDLIILITGVAITFLLLVISNTKELLLMILMALPGVISVLMVAPVPHYHNVRTLIGNIYRFFFNRRRYYWRGWCARYGDDREGK